MSVLIRLGEKNVVSAISRISNASAGYATTPHEDTKVVGEFRVLELIPKKIENKQIQKRKRYVPPPRTNQMATDQDWPSVWPGPRTFHPATVPLPIRQGYPRKKQAPLGKFGNTELMKIPNFLHLTPPAVQRHCEALKQFCTQWPVGLETEEKCRKHFPLEVITSDYCYAGPSIRDPLARIVSIRVKLSSLSLDSHAKDKLLRLVGNRYNSTTDIITITADRCPTRKQNLEYVEYLLTAVYNEALRTEPWEAEKTLADMEYYDWDKHKSREALVSTHSWPDLPPKDFDYETIPHVTEYKIAVSDLINNGEDDHSLNKYRLAVENLLHLRASN
ncbi:28S ribosomal protein S35, mitochondrial [Venturia canescens]|uniref:28S ribosomal protein S35, mitochondrial n=1 Tax=Venturia canescens TaxID=32260 RepID=UPI001C9C4F52|nr:28S ribosomal protein S35, mitochondrial [Venturia canescens]